MCKLFKHEQQETHLDTKNEKTNILTNFIIFGLTRQGLEPMDLPHSRWACQPLHNIFVVV